MIRATASSSAVLANCQYFAREGVPWFDQSNEDTARGHRVHDAIAKALFSGKLPSSFDVDLSDDEHRMVKHAFDFVGYDGGLVEPAFAWNPATDEARILGFDIGRAYKEHGARDDDKCGSADLVLVGPSRDAVTVIDWKTTSGPDTRDATEQGKELCLYAARALKIDRAVFIKVTLTPERAYASEPLFLDAFDLDAHAEEMRRRVAAIPTAEPNPGPWCADGWCPARAGCPATQVRVEELLPAESLSPRFRMSVVPESLEHAAWLLERGEVVEEALKTMWKNLEDYSRANGGIPVGAGKVWAETSYQKRQASAKKLEDLARRKGACDAEIEGCCSKATIRQFRKVNAR